MTIIITIFKSFLSSFQIGKAIQAQKTNILAPKARPQQQRKKTSEINKLSRCETRIRKPKIRNEKKQKKTNQGATSRQGDNKDISAGSHRLRAPPTKSYQEVTGQRGRLC